MANELIDLKHPGKTDMQQFIDEAWGVGCGAECKGASGVGCGGGCDQAVDTNLPVDHSIIDTNSAF